jgi:hypothetical protein
VLWKVYYGDGSMFSDEDGPLAEVPTLNVQAIVQRDTADLVNNVGRRILTQRDFYWWSDQENEWFGGGDLFGLFDYLQRPGLKKVLFGRTVSYGDFAAAQQRALNDPDFPRYSGAAYRGDS